MSENESHFLATSEPTLAIEGLSVRLDHHTLVRDVSLRVNLGSIHCLVGDSGSGKTMTSLASVGLLPNRATANGSIKLAGFPTDLVSLDSRRWGDVRGNRIGYVGQNALGCLHPAYSIGFQLSEAIRRHQDVGRAEARTLLLEELAAVDLPDPELVAASRPAHLSGGMCQRVALAIALCNRPSVLIADEPTTALDDETQSHILQLIKSRVASDGLGVLLITHDQDVVSEVADEVTTIRDGVSSFRSNHRLTQAKVRELRPDSTDDEPVSLEIKNVSLTYGRTGLLRRAQPETLKDVSLTANARTTVGLVGRSGAGKTTLAQIVAGILPATKGEVIIGGVVMTDRLDRLEKAGLVQYVFQDPYGSLNPRRTALAQVAEPLIVAGTEKDEARDRARSILAEVGLTPSQIDRRPRELSGGQCQRVGIARAVIRRPQIVVLDEPVSALDWSIRSEILSILAELQESTGATYLLIAHERALIDEQCDVIYEVADGSVSQI